MRRAFPRNFFKSIAQDDPLLVEDAAEPGMDAAPAAEREASGLLPTAPATAWTPAFASDEPEGSEAASGGDGASEYTINSIFSREGEVVAVPQRPQQIFFLREHEGSLEGLRELNSMLRNGWRVAGAYPSAGHEGAYAAIAVLERPTA